MKCKLVIYCFDENFNYILKMYWNKRLDTFTFNNPTLLNPEEVYELMKQYYSTNSYTEVVKNIEGNEYNNYYIYSIEV